tara:strand:- start:1979 stop:2608 length:630 start_codon:yes stop_codon:yes gene_type:complete
MAISTYSELKASIADFLNRSDLTAVIPTFITLAESQMNRDIRHWEMEELVSGQQSSGDKYMTKPSDWLETIRFQVITGGISTIELAGLSSISDKRQKANDVGGIPRFYSHVRGQFELYPTPDQDIDFELMYYQKIAALSDSNTTNWLLTYAPDVYLYGSLLHSAPYLKEDERVTVWGQLYAAAVVQLNLQSERVKNSGSGIRLNIRGLG